MNSKVTIIIPAYNEERRIGKTLEEYCSFFKKNKVNFEILVVLNACKDNTLKVVKNFQKKFKEIRMLEFEQGGKGFAVTEGFKDVLKRNLKLTGFIDADGSTPPSAFYDLIKNIGDYDAIIANRWDKRSRIPLKQDTGRKIMSRVFNFLVRVILFLPYQDTQCGAKLFKTEPLKKMINNLRISGWAFDVNLLYLLASNNYRIKEIPTTWVDDKNSKIKPIKSSIRMFLSIIRLRLIHSPMQRTSKFFKPIVRVLYCITK